jgi:hypothetical protein
VWGNREEEMKIVLSLKEDSEQVVSGSEVPIRLVKRSAIGYSLVKCN